MITVWLLCTLALTGEVSLDKLCTYHDVIDYLNLTGNNDMYISSRPVRDWRTTTEVHLDINLYAILGVIEKSQIFIPFLWTFLTWTNELISWDPNQFCGILQISLPKEKLWRPDLFVYEMTEKDRSPESPYMYISHNGTVTMEDDLVIASTCNMDVHKFPFDTQSCVLTFGSVLHIGKELQFIPVSNSSRATETSMKVIRSQGEWEFLNITVAKSKLSFNRGEWDQVKYTITMKRRPLLHVINFLLPILFFLTLDLASFFIADMKGEKLGFKVTVLLAISVLLLILNDILPSMSNKTPLIATYCIVIFAFMLLSLLETILVTFLMEKDCAPDWPTEGDSQCVTEDYKRTLDGTCEHECKGQRESCTCSCGVDVKVESEQWTPGAAQLTDTQTLQLILEELQEIRRNFSPHTMGVGKKKPLYWGRIARRLNAGFFCFYLITISLFLALIFFEWMA
ncbi:hypothetical protein AGOR_G00097030 [Albula goreensis]|uniref:5-hydroxytryptamine receptor 3A-like n=1 Tax=Albula goreensis TaxID=1534307 RepID=A0A8T3DNX7_9TELE|nr:hypothetical protein AGOR_G00097030 [Albula goreensis]